MPTAENQPQQPAQPSAYESLDARGRLFVDEYCKHGNGTKAAKKLGDLKDTSAATEAWRMLRNAETKAAIAERLAELSIDAAEVTKQVSDIGKTRLNDYFTLHNRQGYQEELVPLKVLIERKESELEFIREFFNREGLATEEQQKPFGGKLLKLRQELLELLLEAETHGEETVKLVPGKPVVYQVAELDLVKLAKAKEGGRIKSYSVGKEGVKVETYDALAALNTSARMLGLFAQDNEQSKAVTYLNATVEVVGTGVPLAGSEKEVNGV